MTFIKNFLKDEQGQDMVEYALLLGFVALASAAILPQVATAIGAIWEQTETDLGDALP